jgi:hypothetical protein
MTAAHTASFVTAGSRPLWPANALGVDYPAEAARLGAAPLPKGAGGIIDAHTHIHGQEAARLYDKARRLFGVTLTYSMTQLSQAKTVQNILGPDTIRFIAIPGFADADKNHAHRGGYLRTIEGFANDVGARMMKVWASPRLRDFVPDGATDLTDIDSPWRREHCKLAQSLGMMYMVHVADPDTWFTARYNDGSRYGTKRHQYIGLERMLDLFPAPWVAAHMGGWPEDLNFLDGMLERHPNLHLDTSATKWILRELSKHSRDEVVHFLFKWKGRILFGSDLVVMEDQLSPAKSGGSAMGDLASSPEQAYELYCSRYLALRTMFETGYDGPSPIADPDLKMVEPSKYNDMSTPRLQGFALPRELLEELYYGATDRLMNAWWAK